MLVCLISSSPHLSDAATATPLGEFMLIEMRHSSRLLQSRIDIRLKSPGTLHPSWPAFCATACRIELLQPPVQASDCKTCSEAGLLTCSPLPYKQTGFRTRRPQRPGLHDLYANRCMLNCPAPADECRMSASLDVTQPLCKALLQPWHRHVAAFQPSLPSCSDRPPASWPAEHSTVGGVRDRRQVSVLYSLMYAVVSSGVALLH